MIPDCEIASKVSIGFGTLGKCSLRSDVQSLGLEVLFGVVEGTFDSWIMVERC